MHLLEKTSGLTDSATLNGRAAPQSAEHVAERAEETTRLLAFVQELPARQQEVLRLRFQGALSYREIASVTGASVSHVGVLLHGAMAALRGRMAQVPPAACERSPS
jgi:RNA polymerase sigma factor (sigma-70 family)